MVGKVIRINDVPTVIVGVLPAGVELREEYLDIAREKAQRDALRADFAVREAVSV